MNVGLDSEGLLVGYADWIAFLREKRSLLEGQLAKLQGKAGKGKDNNQETAPSAPQGEMPLSPTHPAVTPVETEQATASSAEEVPDWLLQAEPEEAVSEITEQKKVPVMAVEDEADEWM